MIILADIPAESIFRSRVRSNPTTLPHPLVTTHLRVPTYPRWRFFLPTTWITRTTVERDPESGKSYEEKEKEKEEKEEEEEEERKVAYNLETRSGSQSTFGKFWSRGEATKEVGADTRAPDETERLAPRLSRGEENNRAWASRNGTGEKLARVSKTTRN